MPFGEHFYLFIYTFWLHCVFIAAHGLSLVVASRAYSPVCGLMASLVEEHKLQGEVFSSCSTLALLQHGMWDLPGPGIEPTSSALAGRLFTTGLPGKSLNCAIFDSCRQPSSALSHHGLSILPSNQLSRERSVSFLTGTAQFQAIIVLPLGMDSSAES